MKKDKALPITPKTIKQAHAASADAIKARLAEFSAILETGDDSRFWEEMVFCFFTGGCSAKMGMRSIEKVRHLLQNGSQEQLANALSGTHRYPNARSRYIVASREFLQKDCDLRLKARLLDFSDPHERRDWLVREKGIKGLGYKEASHFLRNVGFRGYAILDKHVLNCLAALKIIPDPKPPNTRSRYLTIEESLKKLSRRTGIDFDELDLVLWSMKTGEILK
ncbi:MAG: putative N-glycosylase/DNA lyase [Acidobacteria bacterium OLB17]|nr:MAG: putative N-glycosylase/DNA lyase [Acidobacteria bacterium OLB17]MCZ2390146.1 N-glycosylase/DNA lyase [Acidobacteriota bacterium]